MEVNNPEAARQQIGHLAPMLRCSPETVRRFYAQLVFAYNAGVAKLVLVIATVMSLNATTLLAGPTVRVEDVSGFVAYLAELNATVEPAVVLPTGFEILVALLLLPFVDAALVYQIYQQHLRLPFDALSVVKLIAGFPR